MSVLPANDKTDQTASTERRPGNRALLVTRDSHIRTAGARWLQQAGFEIGALDELERVGERLDLTQPTVVLVEDGLLPAEGGLPGALGRDVPTLALCSGGFEAQGALEAGCSDVALAPFDWGIICHRAARLLAGGDLRSELEQAQALLHQERTAAESTRERLAQLVTRDTMTGLPNRSVFVQGLENALDAGVDVAVVVVDIDRFRLINQEMGRELGDKVLGIAARRLAGSIRAGDLAARNASGGCAATLARLSGDDFTLMLSNVKDAETLVTVVRRLTQVLSTKFVVDGREIYLTASIGAAFAPLDGNDAETLLQSAEVAMDKAKRNGGGLVELYNSSLNDQTKRNLELGRQLHGAIEREEIELHYQPLVDLASHRVIGAEALLRWNHPQEGWVSPGEFVPIAEDTGLMVDIGHWVLRTACVQLRSWIDRGVAPIRVSVNVSRRQLMRGDFAETVRQVLDEAGLDPSLLELELSERGVLRSDPSILRQLADIKEMGVRLSVDDFGTGNSAIAYLKQFPLDALKIDQSYVRGVAASSDDAAIASATIAMAHQLRLDVVAEGVEEEQQLEFLRGCGCDEFQGFLFSPAVPAEEFQRLVTPMPTRLRHLVVN